MKKIKTTFFEFINESKQDVWYHGTDIKFDIPSFENPGREIGFHLGNYNQALNIKKKIKNGDYPNFINVYRTTNLNPLRVDDMVDWLPENIAEQLIKKGLEVDKTGNLLGSKFFKKEDILKALKDNGYNSLIYKNEYEGEGDSIVVFNEDQIEFLERKEIKGKSSPPKNINITYYTDYDFLEIYNKNVERINKLEFFDSRHDFGEDVVFFILEIDNKIAGISHIRKSPYIENTYWISYLSLLEEYRRYGYASKLLEYIVKWFKKNNLQLEASSYTEEGFIKLKPLLNKLTNKYNVSFIDKGKL